MVDRVTTKATKTYLFNGKKSIELLQYPDEAWTWLTGHSDSGESGVKDYFAAIPWLYRGIQLRADAVASMPFALWRGGTETDTSDDWQNVVGFMPSPRRMLRLVEMSLCLTGMAYQSRVTQGANTINLRYLNPSTVQPKLDKDKGLVGFTRYISGSQVVLQPDELVYYWLEDPYTEIGPPTSCPAKAALMASGVLANVDEFVAGFFSRGAIKATLLTVQGMPIEAERQRLTEWWKRVVSGVKNAFGAQVINADTIQPVTIGDGLEDLQNQSLVQEKREDIATALGVPQTKLFSSSASGLGGGGVVEQDDVRFLNDTVIPECEFIASVLNEQVFEALGYNLEFKPETLDAFQEDEARRSASYANYVNAQMLPSIAAQILGIELPPGVEYADLDAEIIAKRERAERMAEMNPFMDGNQSKDEGDKGKDEPSKERVAMREDVNKWRTKALKRGAGKATPFDSDHIPAGLHGAISGALEGTRSLDEVRAVFENALVWAEYP